jgi:WD40 repeat protein
MSKFNFVSKKTEVQTLKSLDGFLKCVKVTADGRYILSCTDVINIWDAKLYDFVKYIKAHNSQVESIDISLDSKIVASCEGETYDDEEREYHEIKLWDMESGVLLKSIKVSGEPKDVVSPDVDTNQIHELKFTPDGKCIAGTTWNKIKIWDLKTLELKLEVITYNSPHSISFSHERAYLMTCTLFGYLNIWEYPSGKLFN